MIDNITWLQIVNQTIVEEGGYCVDYYGPTNYGITLPDLRAAVEGKIISDRLVNADSIRTLTKDEAIEIYAELYWFPNHYPKIGEDSTDSNKLVFKVFDLAVNWGTRRANKFLQSVVGAKVDGWIGPLSLVAIQETCESMGTDWVLARIKGLAEWAYRQSVINNPDRYGSSLNGWLSRLGRDLGDIIP